MKQPVGAAGLLISITERHLHSQGGIRKGRLRLSKTLLGCGQVLTGMDKKEKGGAKGRAPQGGTPARTMQGKSFHVTASNKVITKETHRQETEAAKKTPVTQQRPQPRALHQGSTVKSGTDSRFEGPNKISWQRTPETDETTEKYIKKKLLYQEKFASRNGVRQGPTLEDAKRKNKERAARRT